MEKSNFYSDSSLGQYPQNYNNNYNYNKNYNNTYNEINKKINGHPNDYNKLQKSNKTSADKLNTSSSTTSTSTKITKPSNKNKRYSQFNQNSVSIYDVSNLNNLIKEKQKINTSTTNSTNNNSTLPKYSKQFNSSENISYLGLRKGSTGTSTDYMKEYRSNNEFSNSDIPSISSSTSSSVKIDGEIKELLDKTNEVNNYNHNHIAVSSNQFYIQNKNKDHFISQNQGLCNYYVFKQAVTPSIKYSKESFNLLVFSYFN